MLLDHNSRDVVFAVAGALVNIAADPECKEVLLDEDLQGCDKLVSVVRRAGLRDLPMAAVGCKALYNLLLDLNSPNGPPMMAVEDETLDMLYTSLDELLDATEGGGGDGYQDLLAAGGALHNLLGHFLASQTQTLNNYEDLGEEKN